MKTLAQRFQLAALLALLTAPALSAHDFWIEPSAFRPAIAQRLAVRLRVGQEFKGDPVPRDPSLLQRFALVGPGGESAVPGVPNTEPAGFLSIPAPGLYTIVYASNPEPVQLDAKKFNDYLSQEGLERIRDLRAQAGQSDAPDREVFSRCAKALVAAGGGEAGAGWNRVLGLRLELVPEANPYTLPAGGVLPARLLYEGKPLPGALVTAFTKDHPERKVAARSDARGRVALKLDHPGVWLVKAVHMIPAPRESGADWESFWASVTFEVPGR
ncbi:MAG TPA: DUF4198 domain-containing protein [Thermoanaerobaculia bacterium]|jgi:uncharacterized GH25 family protein|nr:DUF4198 domain-containing protein [Thermoanaerobaculia bacterium]